MSVPSSHPPLPLDALRAIDQLATRFEQAWNTSERVTIEALLPEMPPEHRSTLLKELLSLEIELRRAAGETLDSHVFLQRFPEARTTIEQCLWEANVSTGTEPPARVPNAPSRGAHDFRDLAAETSQQVEEVGVHIGPYLLEQKLGEGGMGVVWVARQIRPVKRRVALKLIKVGMDSRDVVRRFEQERQALAVLDHPSIARVFDAGLTEAGRPYFVMELVNGLPLTRFCDEARLATTQRLEIFAQICLAVQHAHQKGIIHRDLKPANILVTIVDGRPIPKIIDFGVAKALGGNLHEESLTQFGAILGTLEYMAPEQAGYSGIDIDTRADIYALGVILYELLTGLRPFESSRLRSAAWDEMIRIIREEQPFIPSKRLSSSQSLPSLAAARQIDPRRLTLSLRGDLDWIAMKCLEKDRNRRYQTANQLALEIRRHLSDEPVEAGPPNTFYVLGKFVKRHRGQVLAVAMIVTSLLIGLATSVWQLRRAISAERSATAAQQDAVERAADATRAQIKAQFALAESKIHQARSLRRSHRVGQRREALHELSEAHRLFRELAAQGYEVNEENWSAIRDEAASALLLAEVETEFKLPIDEHRAAQSSVADFAQERVAEWPGVTSSFVLRSLKTGEVQATVASAHCPRIGHGQFSDDGRWLFVIGEQWQFEVWDLKSIPPVSAWQFGPCRSISYGMSQPLIAVSVDGKTTQLLDRATGKELNRFEGAVPWGTAIAHNGTQLLLRRGGEMCVVDMQSKQTLTRWEPASSCAEWSTQGDQVAAIVDDNKVQIRDSRTGALVSTIGGFRDGTRALIDSQQNLLFAHDWTPLASICDTRTGSPLIRLQYSGFSGGMHLSSHTGRIALLDRQPSTMHSLRLSRGRMLEFGPDASWRPVISRDGRLCALATNNAIALYELPSGRLLELRPFVSGCDTIDFEGSAALWVTAGWQQPSRAERWPLVRKPGAQGVDSISFGAADRICRAPVGAHWTMSADAARLAVGGDGQQVYLALPSPIDAPETPPEVLQTNQQSLRHTALSPNSRWVFAGGHMSGGVGVYDLRTKTLVKLLSTSGGWGRFSPDSKHIAIGLYNDLGSVWSVGDWRELYSLPGSNFCFAPDGRTLAVKDGASGILLLDAATGHKRLRLETADAEIPNPSAFSPDGKTLYVQASGDRRRVLAIDWGGIEQDLTMLGFNIARSTTEDAP